MNGATESAHMDHPDFRANGRIFATLGYPDKQWGMVKLSPEEQAIFVKDKSSAFIPVKGGWGRSGCTQVRLTQVDQSTLRNAMVAAWSKTTAKRRPAKSPRKS